MCPRSLHAAISLVRITEQLPSQRNIRGRSFSKKEHGAQENPAAAAAIEKPCPNASARASGWGGERETSLPSFSIKTGRRSSLRCLRARCRRRSPAWSPRRSGTSSGAARRGALRRRCRRLLFSPSPPPRRRPPPSPPPPRLPSPEVSRRASPRRGRLSWPRRRLRLRPRRPGCSRWCLGLHFRLRRARPAAAAPRGAARPGVAEAEGPRG